MDKKEALREIERLLEYVAGCDKAVWTPNDIRNGVKSGGFTIVYVSGKGNAVMDSDHFVWTCNFFVGDCTPYENKDRVAIWLNKKNIKKPS